MNIYEFADIIDKDLVIRRYPNQAGRFSAQFDGADTKEYREDPILTSTFGNGVTPEGAVNDYVTRIRGKILVFGAASPNRQLFVVPDYITAE